MATDSEDDDKIEKKTKTTKKREARKKKRKKARMRTAASISFGNLSLAREAGNTYRRKENESEESDGESSEEEVQVDAYFDELQHVVCSKDFAEIASQALQGMDSTAAREPMPAGARHDPTTWATDGE